MNTILALVGISGGEMIIILGAIMIAVVFPILVIFVVLAILKFVKSQNSGVNRPETNSDGSRL